jgi:antirestriction protein ArdC
LVKAAGGNNVFRGAAKPKPEEAMSQKIYDMITDRIIALLEKGVVPWRKPWKAGEATPRNLVSRKPYRGINAMHLSALEFSSPYYLTFNQAKNLGGHIRKGAHGIPVVFWKLGDGNDSCKIQPYLGKLQILLEYKLPFLKNTGFSLISPRPRAGRDESIQPEILESVR